MELEGPPPGEGPLAGKTFVLTGTLPDLTREQATERIESRRRPRDLRRLEEDRLRRGRRLAGSKLEKAERLKVAVLDEAGLLELLPETAPPPQRASAYSTVSSSIMPFSTCGLPPLRSWMKQTTA